MEKEVIDLYRQLTGGKILSDQNSIISANDFTSIMRDRFISELSKRGIIWEGNDLTFSSLMSAKEKLPIKYDLPSNNSGNSIVKEGLTGIGIDIQLISDLPQTDDYWEDEFYKTKFTKEEIGYCLTRKNPVMSFAGIYACKEAIIKCNQVVDVSQINILHDPNNKPVFANFNLSISHSGDYAIAIAVFDSNSSSKPLNNIKQENSLISESNTDADKQQNGIKILIILVIAIVFYIIFRDFVR